MSSNFTLLAEHIQTALHLDHASREDYLGSLPPEIARHVRSLLEFEHATLDLSRIPAIELVLDVLAEPAPTQIGRWHVLELMGRGGMASVYLVERSEGGIRQLAACKIGYARADLEDGLRRETATLLGLNHPGIAHVLDFGHTDAGRPYMVSERIEGIDIVTYANQQLLPLVARLALFEDVLSAVAHAHERLLLHQDIKPDNILVGTDNRPRLIDFGLASIVNSGGDSPVTGYTPRYASPEQMHGERLTVRSDVYSLGVTLATLMEGAGPARSHEDAHAVIAKATHADPVLRYASASDMAADLRAIRQSRPVSARPISPGYRLTRFLQRHPLPMALAVLVVLSIGSGVTATLWQARRAVESARTAEAALVNARAVETFLIEDVLGRANPNDPHYDPSIGIVGVLDHAAEAVQQRFGGNPLAAAGIHTALASIQRNLGRYDQAVSHAEQSATLYAGELGPMHDLALSSRYLQVRALAVAQMDDAEVLLKQTDALAADRLDQDTRLALDAAIARAEIQQNRMRGPEALDAYTRMARLQARIAPDDPTLAVTAANGMAEAYLRMERPAEAIDVLEALPLASYSGMQQATIHRKLAWAYRDQASYANAAAGKQDAPEDYERALEHGMRALHLFREHLGNDAHTTLAALGTVSSLHELRGECDAALDTGREAYEGMRRAYGDTSQAALIERGNLGSKQFECGHQEDGLTNLQAALHGLGEHYGADNGAAQSFTFTIIWFLTRADRHDDAMDWVGRLNAHSLRDATLVELLGIMRERQSATATPAQRSRFEAMHARLLSGRSAEAE
ncbi:serine/threonine-protein kinase [Xanthomonadaceae bacterium JHOS43]|nr:serine/threonine-protein kinase [Xanthomonadaceae bacterium JHOS43]